MVYQKTSIHTKQGSNRIEGLKHHKKIHKTNSKLTFINPILAITLSINESKGE